MTPPFDIVLKASEVYWIRYLAFGKLNQNTEEQWIGFSHKPDEKFSHPFFLNTPETKVNQFVYINNITNKSNKISDHCFYLINNINNLDLFLEFVQHFKRFGVSENIKKLEFLAIQYYRLFGYDGSMDSIILNSSLFYMIQFPQIYFASPIKSKAPVKSSVFSEKISYENLTEVCKVLKGNQPIFINQDGNIVLKTNSIPFVIPFGRQLMTTNEKSLEIFNERTTKTMAKL